MPEHSYQNERPKAVTLRHKVSLSLIVNALVIAVEMAGGWWIGSVGLIGDAAHNLIDQAGLFLTLYAVTMSAAPSTATRTFGHHRIGTLAAFGNAVILLAIAVGIVVLSIHRLLEPVTIPGTLMFAIALFSFVGNLSIALLLQAEARNNLNVRAAFWHNLGDAWVSLGVIAAGLLVATTGWNLLDPLVSIGIALVIVWGTWGVLRESSHILLEGVPFHLDSIKIASAIATVPGVVNVHDLHVWGLDAHLPSLTCHLLIGEGTASEPILRTVRRLIAVDFGIRHMTIQLETSCCHPDELHCNVQSAYHGHLSTVNSHLTSHASPRLAPAGTS
jgi:cobalt-zinc-cadmium efflux system protein